MSKKQRIFEAHIVTLGDGQVGKTSIILRYIDNSFTLNYLSTIGIDSKIKKVKLKNNEEIKVKISDTAGQERFKSTTPNPHSHIFCYIFF
jgi:small GTP-binding protein